MPMVPAFDGYVEMIVPVSTTCLVGLERDKYPVPCEFAHQKPSLRLYPEQVTPG